MAERVKGWWRRWALWTAVVPALLAVVVLGVFASQGRASPKGLIKVRLGGDRNQTRVVVDLARSVRGQLIPTDAASGSVVITLPGVDSGGDLSGQGAGLVRSWAVDQVAGAARLRLTLNRQAEVRRRFLLPPGDGVAVYRYVIDLEARQGAADIGPPDPKPAVISAPIQTLTSTVSPRPSARAGKRLVVIDAGHGGHDPGATGVSTHEKLVTLAAAKALKERLERTGRYRVVMTRASDVYIPLDKRVGVARKAGADLFISLHADAGSDPSLRGASVYTLSEHGADRAARKVMRGDDWFRDVSLPGRDPAVDRILLDLTQRATTNRSSAFARVLLQRLDEDTTLLQRSHRDAGFAVLLAPDVPAVLFEMGFITNPQDEAALSDPVRRGRLMDAVARAVDDYFDRAQGFSTASAAP